MQSPYNHEIKLQNLSATVSSGTTYIKHRPFYQDIGPNTLQLVKARKAVVHQINLPSVIKW